VRPYVNAMGSHLHKGPQHRPKSIPLKHPLEPKRRCIFRIYVGPPAPFQIPHGKRQQRGRD